ncbi:hypothetical protein A2154_02570 [Candidatus Gottesmanbacteria bacterium RBG_16_43_7]|uniref:ADP,ATP carrier protein n=1 Tax=Candidatus Gottesmanbacteria bacterium RBG_16_43_7 TaxID=1798373 RepID=A0A1F5ZD12_9BACT|nr:MAG: hypothetical protein A2154_02570 [Candidatus Gottesmanbacteria bacterium RBG_16_43_7]
MHQDSLSKEELMLVVIDTLFYFVIGLATVFLSVYLFRLGGFSTVIRFHLVSFLFLLILYNASGYFLSKLSSRILIVGSFLLFSGFWGLLVCLKNAALEYVIPLGILHGTANGLYWSGFNLSQYILTHKTTRLHYFGKINAWQNLFRSIAPIVGAGVIYFGNTLFQTVTGGYGMLFILICILYVLMATVAWFLPDHRGIEFSLVHILKHKRGSLWKLVLTQQGILGLFDVAFSTLINVLLYVIFISETAVGIFNSLVILLVGISSFFAVKLLRRFPRLPLGAAIMTSAGLLIFGFSLTKPGVIILGILFAASNPFLRIPLSANILNGIDSNPEPWQKKYHMFLERDTVLGMARVVSYAGLALLFASGDKPQTAALWLRYIAILPLILGVLLVISPVSVENKTQLTAD